jgi:hypothetical protein
MKELASGVMVAFYATIALFFLRFWKRSADSLFLLFAIAFFLLSCQRLALTLTAERFESTAPYYITRLVAFLLILAAIWNKNRPRS